MASSSGYNNPGYCNQYDYDQLARLPSQGVTSHGNQTYITTTATDNYCYEEDEEIQLSTMLPRQHRKRLVREPPIGASTTFRIVETRAECISPRSTATPMSPKRQRPATTSSGSGHRIDTTVTSPRTPRKNVSVIVTSTPRKPNAMTQHRTQNLSPGRQQVCTRDTTPITPASSPRKAILATSPAKISVRNAKYVIRPETSAAPQRSTAVISPMYTCANTSVASTASVSSKSREPFLATGVTCRKSPPRLDVSPGLKASWIHMPTPYQTPPTGTIATAGTVLLLCGTITAVLCLYMISKEGRRYYLDFGVLSGFGSVLLGFLGFRSRRWQWLPNRNYVTGYIVLSMFSLLTCAGLIVIVNFKPQPGEPVADVAGGAVCGIAVLSLVIAAFGVLSSRCCKYPPPDNRVEHCAEGFTL